MTTTWISVADKLPESRTLVWIYVVYDPSSYDDVLERVSIGSYENGRWEDILDFSFADDYTVTHWAVFEWPEKPTEVD